jgi:hypothetical protein
MLVFALLFGTAAGAAALARRLPRPSWPYVLRQGFSNLFRPQNQTLLFLLSLGLGNCLLLTVLLVRGSLLESLKPRDLRASPNIYLVDVQEDQRAGVKALLAGLDLPLLENAPIVTMRIASVKGVPVRELEQQAEARAKAAREKGGEPKGTPRWVLQREYRSSYRAELTGSEELAAGASFSSLPWKPGAEPVPVSLEAKIARDLELGVGDELGLDVQGVPLRAKVVNLRKVDWSRFNLNFFMVFPPGVLEAAPGFTVITTRIPKEASSGALQRALVREFPNVSAIDLTLILETVTEILEQISRVVEVLAGVTVLAGRRFFWAVCLTATLSGSAKVCCCGRSALPAARCVPFSWWNTRVWGRFQGSRAPRSPCLSMRRWLISSSRRRPGRRRASSPPGCSCLRCSRWRAELGSAAGSARPHPLRFCARTLEALFGTLKAHRKTPVADRELVEIRQAAAATAAATHDLFLQRVGDELVCVGADGQRLLNVREKFRHPVMHPAVGRQKPDLAFRCVQFVGGRGAAFG